ncbi:DUF4907 domain-containing protein [Plebeiibacterium marinum]|uniref:DUF4907 domain-containing protein n=1 Tax=Plebeiibacterium marinum TaxID=2992111 RepID=A0AAE3MCJ2_9BACT|nr:DUF4907 domain-containing protein [Plebeiobacterium marinum]MCW3805110.1 DUF4907 domain-containing protein [Plebeiobacterium marinum]
MRTKTKFVSILILFVICFTGFSCKNKKKYHIEYTIIEVDNGWGYDISVNGKVFIHQDVIPGVQGKKAFYSQQDAEKAAKLVVKKIENKEMPPAVSTQELKELGIKTDS